MLSYSTEMYLPIDTNHSPLNVGLAVPLADWSAALVHDLARRHGLDLTEAEVSRLMALIGGHPHLVRLALYGLVEHGLDLDELIATAATEAGLFAEHLKPLLWHLQKHTALGEAASLVMTADAPIRLPTEIAFKLVSLGVVRMHHNLVVPGRELYRRYLSERLPCQQGTAAAQDVE